jgi:hypothetical protein
MINKELVLKNYLLGASLILDNLPSANVREWRHLS